MASTPTSPRLRQAAPLDAAASRGATAGHLRPVRAGFVIDSLTPGESTAEQLILMLRRFDRKRTIPQLCCLWRNPALETLDLGCRTAVLEVDPSSSTAGLGGLRAIRRWIRREALDLVVTVTHDATIVGTAGGWSVGVPVISYRSSPSVDADITWFAQFRRRHLNAVTRGFVASSETIARRIGETYGILSRRITVIPPAVDTEVFRPDRQGETAEIRAALGIDAKRLVIACYGGTHDDRDVERLAGALAIAAAELPDLRIVISCSAGGGSVPLSERCAALGLGDHVMVLRGQVDAAALLRATDLTVLASAAESQGEALIRSLASGVPFVAMGTDGNDAVLRDGEGGVVVSAGDVDGMARAILALAGDTEHRAATGVRGRAIARQEYSVPAVLARWDEYLAIQARLLAGLFR